MERILFSGTEHNGFYGTDSFLERNGMDFTERIVFFGTERNGTERFIPEKYDA